MPKTFGRRIAGLGGVILAGSLGLVPGARGQDVRPLAPILEPARPADGSVTEGSDRPAETGVVPLPAERSRAETADRARSRTAVLPVGWTDVGSQYQPYWLEVGPVDAFGIDRWSEWFALSGLAPSISPHPFFSPFGVLAYDGWLFERYRAAWTTARAPDRLVEAAGWLQRGDRALAAGRPLDAATAYRRSTLVAPELPHGYLGLGAALAEMREDEAAAQAFREGVDRYPGWLPLSIGWDEIYGDRARLAAVQRAAEDRAAVSGASSRFVAGVLDLFGDRVERGRALLSGLEGDPGATLLLARGPR